nr:MAG: HEase/DNA adenine MTase [Lokiarchaeota virus Skoll Meg22_1214]
MAHYLKNLGKAYEKYIPSEFMNLSRRQLKILFDSLIKGDGCISKGMISYYTSSKKLADQIQEICIKIGYNANIKIRDRTKDKKISNIKGRFIRAAHLSYEIYVRKSKECTLRRNQHFKKKYYEGMVYCCTVPNHVILVRRNGKTAWCGNSGIVILNKPRCRYECGNDINSEIINYLLVIREHPKEFDELKKGVFGLVSQEIYNRIINKTLKPKNNIERAYFFYYLNKLSFGGGANKINFEGDINESIKTKGHRGLIDNCSLSREGYGRVDKKVVENARKDFQFKTSNYGGIGNPRVMPQADLHEHKVEQYKKDFQNKINRYRGMTPKTSLLKNAPFKGLLPQTTRPHTNNDCGILTPIDPQAIKRLRYVNLTCYPFQKVYKMFHRAFHERKGLEKECFMYCDPPYPGTDDSYLKPFTKEDHDDLISILLNCPFHWLLSIGGECDDYLNRLDSFIIKKVNVKYSTSANYQYERREYLIMNYDIKKLPLMIHESSQYRIDNYIQEYKNE